MKSGRKPVPTEAGRLAYGYAEEVIELGQGLVDAIGRRPTLRPQRLAVGIDDVLPKKIAHRCSRARSGSRSGSAWCAGR